MKENKEVRNILSAQRSSENGPQSSSGDHRNAETPRARNINIFLTYCARYMRTTDVVNARVAQQKSTISHTHSRLRREW
jgi:hypothetical protein